MGVLNLNACILLAENRIFVKTAKKIWIKALYFSSSKQYYREWRLWDNNEDNLVNDSFASRYFAPTKEELREERNSDESFVRQIILEK